MDSRSHQSSPSSQNTLQEASAGELSASPEGQYKTVTSEHGLSHRVSLEKPTEASDQLPAKIHIEPNINLAIDTRHRLLIEDDSGKALSAEQEWRVRQNYRDEMLSMLCDFSCVLNSQLQQVLNVHLATPQPNQELPSGCLFEPLHEAPPEEPAYQHKGWVDKLLPWRAKEINNRNAVLASQFRSQQAVWKKKAEEHEQAYLQFWDTRLSTAEKTEAFLDQLLGKALQGTDSHTEISVDKGTSAVWVNTHFPEIKMLPGLEHKVLEKELRLTCKSLSPTKKRQYYMQQVHAIGFRLIGEVFTAVPELKQVVFSGYSKRLNPATAHLQQDYLYSVKVTRDQWQSINFQSLSELSLTEVFTGFELRRNMSKTGIFKAIEPFSKEQVQQSDIFTTQGMAG